jgi:hypothetical protein
MDYSDYSKLIKDRRHPKIAEKLDIWNLISDSYLGGDVYQGKKHLYQYPRESSYEYKERCKRAVFLNYTQPLADMLTGFLFSSEPVREYPTELEYLVKKASKRKSLSSFMQSVSVQALLYPVGILVDSPHFNLDEAPTLADREALGINPYCTIYFPAQIRDFSVSDDLSIDWILLDNSYIDNSNPMVEAVNIKQYRLWTREYYQDWTFVNDDYEVSEEFNHGLGEVPFIFHGWRDQNEDLLSETPFEDIAILNRALYNMLSYLESMLASGSFKTLFYPIETKKDLPDEIKTGGYGELAVVPFKGTLSHKPYFDGAELGDVSSFIEAMQLYIKAMLQKLGLDKDTEKNGVQSGEAKRLEYKKMEALLRLGAEQHENTEKAIFRLASLWEGKPNVDVKIEYPKDFIKEDIDVELQRLYEAMTLPVESIKHKAMSEVVKRIFKDQDPGVVKSMIADIEKADDSGLNNIRVDVNPETTSEDDKKEKDNA